MLAPVPPMNLLLIRVSLQSTRPLLLAQSPTQHCLANNTILASTPTAAELLQGPLTAARLSTDGLAVPVPETIVTTTARAAQIVTTTGDAVAAQCMVSSTHNVVSAQTQHCVKVQLVSYCCPILMRFYTDEASYEFWTPCSGALDCQR